jgi:hypothetical protein
VDLVSICGGVGACRRCRVQVVSGVVSLPTAEDRDTFSEAELELGCHRTGPHPRVQQQIRRRQFHVLVKGFPSLPDPRPQLKVNESCALAPIYSIGNLFKAAEFRINRNVIRNTYNRSIVYLCKCFSFLNRLDQERPVDHRHNIVLRDASP